MVVAQAVAGLAAVGQLDGRLDRLTDPVQAALSLLEPRLRHLDLVADPGLLALEQIEWYGTGVVGLEQFRPFLGQLRGIPIHRMFHEPTCSAGFAMAKDVRLFMLTAAHCSDPPGGYSAFMHGSAVMGSTTFKEYRNNGDTDAQLIETEASPYTWGSTAYHPNQTAAATSDGDMVCFSGAFAHQTCNVEVTFTNYCADFTDGITTCGLAIARRGDARVVDPLGGDSGGPVFKYFDDGNNLQLRGIILGGEINNEHVGIFSPITTIMRTFNAEPVFVGPVDIIYHEDGSIC